MREATMVAPAEPRARGDARPGFGAARAVMVLVLFLLGVVGGAYAQRVINPPPPPNPYAQLPLVGEPEESAALVRVILADDAKQLAGMLDQELLQALGEGLQPIDEVLEMKFVGATERKGDILAGYIASGRAGQMGGNFSVGIVFRVQGGKVVGVN